MSPSTKPLALIIGAGPNIGAAVAAHFRSAGYSIALTSRSAPVPSAPTAEGDFLVRADMADPSSVPSVFAAVRAHFNNVPPSVVVYNVAAFVAPPVADHLFSIPVDQVSSSLNIAITSPWAAAAEAVKGFEELDKQQKEAGSSTPAVPKAFIYTGNILNTTIFPAPAYGILGTGKSGASYWIGTAAKSYKAKGYRFFYADERAADGKSAGGAIDGPAHASFYYDLANSADVESRVPWHATFVKGKGYVKFPNAFE